MFPRIDRFPRWPGARVALASLFAVASAFALLAPMPPALGGGDQGGPPHVTRVEEDWALVLNEPRSDVNAPQFHTVMSPFEHADGIYAQVGWNYRELPSFESGGLQLQAWDGDMNLDDLGVGELPLSTNAETVTWTQSLETDTAKLTFRVLNGNSSSWGPFGGESMTIEAERAVPNLNRYSPEVSVANSWVTYGSNRVNVLMIVEVRAYGQGGVLLARDTTPKVVFMLGE